MIRFLFFKETAGYMETELELQRTKKVTSEKAVRWLTK